MQTVPPAYTKRNILAAFLLAAELICFVAPVVYFIISERLRRAEGRPGWEGEAGGLLVALLIPLALYTLAFFVRALLLALKRGSRPMSVWVILFGLLPIIGLTLLFGSVIHPR